MRKEISEVLNMMQNDATVQVAEITEFGLNAYVELSKEELHEALIEEECTLEEYLELLEEVYFNKDEVEHGEFKYYDVQTQIKWVD